MADLFVLCKFKKRLFSAVSILIPDKIKFRSLFIKTNELLDNLHKIDKSSLYIAQKTIKHNKTQLDTLYKKILSS